MAATVDSNIDVFESVEFKAFSSMQRLPEAKRGDVTCRIIIGREGFAKSWVSSKRSGLIIVIRCGNGSVRPIIGK